MNIKISIMIHLHCLIRNKQTCVHGAVVQYSKVKAYIFTENFNMGTIAFKMHKNKPKNKQLVKHNIYKAESMTIARTKD